MRRKPQECRLEIISPVLSNYTGPFSFKTTAVLTFVSFVILHVFNDALKHPGELHEFVDVLFTGKGEQQSGRTTKQTAGPTFHFGSCSECVPTVSSSGGSAVSTPCSDSEQGCRQRRICSSVHCSSCKACSLRVN